MCFVIADNRASKNYALEKSILRDTRVSTRIISVNGFSPSIDDKVSFRLVRCLTSASLFDDDANLTGCLKAFFIVLLTSQNHVHPEI